MAEIMTLNVDDNIVYLENGDWYDASQISREEYEMVIESIEYSEANPDSSMSLEEFRKWSKEMLDEKIRSKHRAKCTG
ncbi:MAG: hypothetical protein FWB74_07280 [Defluviitaleaceae bacterium]|nr:hypothetical protein [Defluviitaleaceae bacterium]